jgi:hypothetical protein
VLKTSTALLLIFASLISCDKTRAGQPLSTDPALEMTSEVGLSHSSIQSNLTIWERMESCKKSRIICRQVWEQIPDTESDPCLTMIEKTGPNSILMLPASAHFLYTLKGPSSDFSFEIDTGEDVTIMELPDCR